MNGITAFTDEQWNTLVRNVAEAYEDLTLKRGFQYERMGSVLQLSLSGDRRLEAEVKEGDGICRVELALDAPAGGSCDCADRKPCRHQAAALMKLAGLAGRSAAALSNARTIAARTLKAEIEEDGSGPSGAEQDSSPQNRVVEDAETRGDSAQTERTSEDSRQPEPPPEKAAIIASSGISAWHKGFERAASSLAGRTRNPKFAELTLERIFEGMPQLPPGIERLYRLNAHLFVLSAMVAPAGTGLASSPGYYAHLAVSEISAAIGRLFAAPLPERHNRQVRERLSETLRFLRRRMLTESREQDAFANAYYLLLTRWAAPESPGKHGMENAGGDERFGADSPEPAGAGTAADQGEAAEERAEVYESELQYLMDEERELGRSLDRRAWLGANAWSQFRLGRDEQARSLLKQAAELPYFSPKKLPDFFSPLAASGEWERLADWLEAFGPLLERARAGLEDYGHFWDEALARVPDAESRMWAALQDMLPHASSLYLNKLLERGLWNEWMDYQLSAGAEPAHFKVTDLAPIEKNAPELLLPFYHQAVERLVEQRNRDGYKAAVRLLKRLDKLYKKMKRTERWDTFMESFNARYGRLRALQEEMKKGKLML
ncbi:hypothetical protein QWJ34_17690 [Saccharibacillus sp. CPCC 101409]|uniref:hypothetical protein n=1 Tax=Saccharibacillus sp. CPCC 101409 TaxID=3058041 RepID=UPI002674105E|nr:hypothetical protein [Saccharibacillus sp. CPCC 101409]MDO3411601.1 hypothetical protein [Saccharibacillus sp. CPCC 101409]